MGTVANQKDRFVRSPKPGANPIDCALQSESDIRVVLCLVRDRSELTLVGCVRSELKMGGFIRRQFDVRPCIQNVAGWRGQVG